MVSLECKYVDLCCAVNDSPLALCLPRKLLYRDYQSTYSDADVYFTNGWCIRVSLHSKLVIL